MRQSEKFSAAQDDSDDELEEESLLETPLDKVEPYSIFKNALLSMCILKKLTRSLTMHLLTMKRRATAGTAAALRKPHQDSQPRRATSCAGRRRTGGGERRSSTGHGSCGRRSNQRGGSLGRFSLLNALLADRHIGKMELGCRRMRWRWGSIVILAESLRSRFEFSEGVIF